MDSLWTRRSNTSSKLSLSMSNDGPTSQKVFGPPSATNKSRGGDSSSHSRHYNPFNNVSPLVTSIPSPSTSASSAFGLGSGAFATFSSNLKTPTSTRPQADGVNNSSTAVKTPQSAFPIGTTPTTSSTSTITKKIPEPVSHPLKYTWVVWYRSPGSKFQDYEKSTNKIASFSTIEEFWTIYTHLRRPNSLPHVSDYHFFKQGIRPVWEDKENKNGGKWIIRLKKGVSTRYWEELLLAIVGDQFSDAGEDLCGAVLSIRSNEDVLSVWTKVDGASCLKIKQTMCRKLEFPPETQVLFKTHASSIEAINNKNSSATINSNKDLATATNTAT